MFERKCSSAFEVFFSPAGWCHVEVNQIAIFILHSSEKLTALKTQQNSDG